MSQGTKRFFAVAGGLILLALIIMLLMPKERADQISDSIQRLSGDSGIICLDYHRSLLKDPDSASLVRSVKSGSQYLPEVQITYKAKNSFGAFTTTSAQCAMDKDGSVNVSLTELKRVNAETSRGLDHQINCLGQKVSDLKQKNPMAEVNFQQCQIKASLQR